MVLTFQGGGGITEDAGSVSVIGGEVEVNSESSPVRNFPSGD
jgi:hypothetical protein